MKYVFEHIVRCASKLAEEPLFAHLRDANLDPAARLKFVPWTTHFVMTFADLYRFFLPVAEPRDRYEELMNVHLAEESTHWKWFLTDLSNSGLDPQLRFTDSVRFIWSDATIKTRRLAYEICALSAKLNSLQKLVMVQCIEATGRVGLEAAVPVGDEVKTESGRHLIYFGNHHLETERGHTLEEANVHRSLTEIELSDAERAEMFRIVEQVFEHFHGFVREAHDIVRSGRAFGDSRPETRLTG